RPTPPIAARSCTQCAVSCTLYAASMFDLRAEFISDLARRLHTAGVSASRLEGAVRNTAHALDVTCEIWATPTGLLLSLGDGSAEGAQVTRVLRLEPGNVDLSALVALNDIA